jgi:hypothetical protein
MIMTRQEILNLPHLLISEVLPNKFVHLHCEDGYILTDYIEGKNIKDYYGSICVYFPIKDEYDVYRVITQAEHENYLALQEQSIEQDATR